MLVGERAAVLVGYFAPTDLDMGFVVPLFRRPGSNRLLVQESDADERISAFREVDPPTFHDSVPDGVNRALGDPALWGFRNQQGFTTVEERPSLQRRLRGMLDAVDLPFLKVQMAQFCDGEAELFAAWREAYRHLAERSPRSARAWRDVVVLPAQIRLAVEHAILAHGLDASVVSLGRDVAVEISNGAIRLKMDARLHEAFDDHPDARAALDRGTAMVRRAFDLEPGQLRLDPMAAQIDRPTEPPSGWDDLSLAAIGTTAIDSINYILPTPVLMQKALGKPVSMVPHVQPAMAVVRNGVDLEWYWDGDATPFVDDASDNILVVFHLVQGKELGPTIDWALNVARASRRSGRTIIAVIPHFPDIIVPDPDKAEDMLAALDEAFDAIWALSDRSAWTRQSLAYGPARSEQAASAHFRFLKALVRQHRADWSRSADIPTPGEKWSVIGSATGDQSMPRLTQQALMRVSHHLFDYESASSAIVLADGGDHFAERDLQQLVAHDTPHARVTVNHAERQLPSIGHIYVALQGVRISTHPARDFEDYCARALSKAGWAVEKASQHYAFEVARKDIKRLAIDCHFLLEPLNERRSVPGIRRSVDASVIMLTNAPIRRGVFARLVLDGVVPVHVSRIAQMEAIYRQRYALTLRTLRKHIRDVPGALAPSAYAALDWLGPKRGPKWWGKLDRVTLNWDAFRCEAHSNFVICDIQQMTGMKRGKDHVLVPFEAQLILDDRGWHLNRLEIDRQTFV